jgi:hypothetical protein
MALGNSNDILEYDDMVLSTLQIPLSHQINIIFFTSLIYLPHNPVTINLHNHGLGIYS